MLGGIGRRLATTSGRVVLAFSRVECEFTSSCDDEDGWTLAWAMLMASESINVNAKIAAVNDLLQDTMVLEDVFLPNDEWVLGYLFKCVKDRNRGKKRFLRLFLNNKNGDWKQVCHQSCDELWLFQLPSSKAKIFWLLRAIMW